MVQVTCFLTYHIPLIFLLHTWPDPIVLEMLCSVSHPLHVLDGGLHIHLTRYLSSRNITWFPGSAGK